MTWTRHARVTVSSDLAVAGAVLEMGMLLSQVGPFPLLTCEASEWL